MLYRGESARRRKRGRFLALFPCSRDGTYRRLWQALLPVAARSCLRGEDGVPCPMAACRRWAKGCWAPTSPREHPSLGFSPSRRAARPPRCSPLPRPGAERAAKEGEVSKPNACVICAGLTRLFVVSHVAQIPALVSTKHYSCARSSFKSVIPMGLLTCARIPRLRPVAARLSAKQG